jgi:hypothetical protein
MMMKSGFVFQQLNNGFYTTLCKRQLCLMNVRSCFSIECITTCQHVSLPVLMSHGVVLQWVLKQLVTSLGGESRRQVFAK